MPEQSSVVERIAKCEQEIEQLKSEWQGIPDLIEVRLRLTDSRVARLHSEFSSMRIEMGGLKRGLAEVEGKLVALPRVLAEMLDEREKRQR